MAEQFDIEYTGPTRVSVAEDGSIHLAATFDLLPVDEVVEPPPIVEPPPVVDPPPVIEPPPTTPATVIIAAGSTQTQVQAKLDRAAAGDIFQFEAGEYEMQLKLQRPGVTLMGQGATFVHPQTNAAGCFAINADGVTLDGMAMRPKPGVHVYGLIQVGRNDAATTSVDMLPKYVTLRNLVLRGDPKKLAQRAIMFEAGQGSLIENVDADEFGADVDAQVLWATNGGGWTIKGCKFRASGQCILIAGNLSYIKDHTIGPMTLIGNDFRGRQGKIPDGSGRNLLSKYIIEFKRGQDITIIGNDLHDLTAGVNAGSAIGLTERTERGRNPWAVIKNVVIKNNRLWNIGRFINAMGKDNNCKVPPPPAKEWIGTFTSLTVENNLAVMSGPPGNFGFQFLCGVDFGTQVNLVRNTIAHGMAGGLASSVYLESTPAPGGPPSADYKPDWPMENMTVSANVLDGNIVGRGTGGNGALKAYSVNSKVVDNLMLSPAALGGNLSKPRADVLDANYSVKEPYKAYGSSLSLPAGVQMDYEPEAGTMKSNGNPWVDELLEELRSQCG